MPRPWPTAASHLISPERRLAERRQRGVEGLAHLAGERASAVELLGFSERPAAGQPQAGPRGGVCAVGVGEVALEFSAVLGADDLALLELCPVPVPLVARHRPRAGDAFAPK